MYWTNFNLPTDLGERKVKGGLLTNDINSLCEFHNYDFKQYKGGQRIGKVARNLVDYEAGKTILETAFGIITQKVPNQIELF